jgi:uncharacterized C2H2 Zn-finger protein
MNFECTECGKLFNQKIHLLNHINRKIPCTKKKEQYFQCSICKKTFFRKDYYIKHISKKKQCTPPINIEQYEYHNSESDNDIASELDTNNTITNKLVDDTEETKDLKKAMELLKNKDLHKIINLLQNDNIKTALLNSDNNTTNSNNNSNNTQNTINNTNCTYLLNFVSKNYPNAKNIEDCINVKNITPKLLQDCYDMYFLEGTIHIIKKMCDIGEENRPFHCTDASRGNYIYKSNDVWKIDVGGEQIKSHIIPVIDNTYKQVHAKRIYDNPKSERAKANMCLEMTSDNVKKVCGKALRKTTGLFIAKNSKNGKYIKDQNKLLIA